MNRFFWAFIALFQLTFGLAQTSARQERPAGNAAALAESLTKGLTSDSLKVNAFFDWITANVGYDVSVFQPGNRINPELQRTGRVLQTGKAVCQGYANLFYDLCRHVGIPVEIIEGYCRYSPQNPEQLQLHAWNAVKVNDRWYVADLTWGTGYLDLTPASTCRRPTGPFSWPSPANWRKRTSRLTRCGSCRIIPKRRMSSWAPPKR
jgi:hypothetical protein